MDFALTEEQRALQTLAREFAEREVRPVALDRDHVPDHRACFPEDLIRRGSALGLRTLCVPAAYGGPGIRDMLTLVVVAEELALGDPVAGGHPQPREVAVDSRVAVAMVDDDE